jgi:sarcosine oxidase delta subunit
MEERDFYDEKPEQKTHTLTCPHCGKADEYQIGWLVRRKRAQVPRGADERDRARFAKWQSYMVRKDDQLACKNIRCRKRFEVAGVQTVAFI